MFRNFRLCIPLSARGVGSKTHVVDGHKHTGLNPFYGANHVFPEWQHHCVGPILIIIIIIIIM